MIGHGMTPFFRYPEIRTRLRISFEPRLKKPVIA
jgi:hypothetical protein